MPEISKGHPGGVSFLTGFGKESKLSIDFAVFLLYDKLENPIMRY